jgi:hypothetical protein
VTPKGNGHVVDVFYHCHGFRAIGSACPVADSCPISSASPPRSAVLECTHISSVDYTVIVGLGELLEDFQKKGVALAFVGLQVREPGHLMRRVHTLPIAPG